MPTFNAYTGDLYVDDGRYWTPLHIATNTATATAATEEIVIDVNTPIGKEAVDYLVKKYGQRREGDERQEEAMELREVLGF